LLSKSLVVESDGIGYDAEQHQGADRINDHGHSCAHDYRPSLEWISLLILVKRVTDLSHRLRNQIQSLKHLIIYKLNLLK